jgi:hypothetical protein
VIARKKPVNVAATKPLPTLHFYEVDDSWLLGRFMGSALADSAIIGYFGLFARQLWFPVFDSLYSFFGADDYSKVFAGLTYVCLCLIAGIGLARFKNRKKDSEVASARPGGGTANLPPPSPPGQPATGSLHSPSHLSLMLAAKRGSVVGNSLTFVYHDLDCSLALNISAKNRRVFGSRKEASVQGYERCRTCLH